MVFQFWLLAAKMIQYLLPPVIDPPENDALAHSVLEELMTPEQATFVSPEPGSLSPLSRYTQILALFVVVPL